MNELLTDSVDKLLSMCATPAAVREIEQGGDARQLWQDIEASGFAMALVPEANDGAGLSWGELFVILISCGRHALPVPLGATAYVRSLLASEGCDLVTGSATLAAVTKRIGANGVAVRSLPFGRVSQWVAVNLEDQAWLLPVEASNRTGTGIHGSLQAHLNWPTWPDGAISLGKPKPLREVGAVLTAGMMAGAMSRVLAMTVSYANDRVQFGRSIGKFQAVQQQISLMAEHVHAAHMAAEMGCAGGAPDTGSLLAALAKASASESVPLVASTAHAVHGAMGITAEYDLQLWTRRLHEWRLDCGGESYWHQRLGEALLQDPSIRVLDFLLLQLSPDLLDS
jgi:acyl-CoA dehydrogenase